MRIIKQIIFTIAISTLLLSGCTTLYKPNAVHSPMLSQKGDGHVTASLGVAGTSLANFQAAYAVSDHIGLLADGMYHFRSVTHSNSTESSTEELHIYSFGGGAGYFEKIGNKQKLVFQFYLGGNKGVTEATIQGSEIPRPEVDAEFVNIYAQPGIVFLGKYLDMAVDVRLNYAQLYNIKSYRYESFDWYNYDENRLFGSRLDFILCEPTFSLKAGGKHLKGLLQAGFSIPVMNAEGYFTINSGSFLGDSFLKFNLGVSYTFGRTLRE